MKSLIVGIAALLAIGANIPAHAADMAVKAPPPAPAPPPYDWSGLYVGANFGGAWSSGSLDIPGNNFYGGLTEFVAGGQVGYNFQAGHLLFGVEGDFDGATFSHPALPGPTLGSVSDHWIGTAAGRAGFAADRWLIYGKLGGGWVHSSAIGNFSGQSFSGSNTSGGWLAGAGLEYGFKSHWTVRLEYDHLSLAGWTSPTIPAIALNRDLQMVTAGISYKFESGITDVASTRADSGGEPTRGPGKEIAKPDCRPRQSSIPEQYELQRSTVWSHTGNFQHPASRTHAYKCRLEHDLTYHRPDREPARPDTQQQHQWNW